MDISYFYQTLWLLLDAAHVFLAFWVFLLIYYTFVPFTLIAGVFSLFYRRGAPIRITIIFVTASAPVLTYLFMRFCTFVLWDPAPSQTVLLFLAGVVLCVPFISITRIAFSKDIKSNNIDKTVVMDMLFFIVSFTSLLAIFLFIIVP